MKEHEKPLLLFNAVGLMLHAIKACGAYLFSFNDGIKRFTESETQLPHLHIGCKLMRSN